MSQVISLHFKHHLLVFYIYTNFHNQKPYIQTFLTRARTGHIVTQVYLRRFHISDTPTYLWYNIYDDLEHILLYCPSINHKKKQVKVISTS